MIHQANQHTCAATLRDGLLWLLLPLHLHLPFFLAAAAGFGVALASRGAPVAAAAGGAEMSMPNRSRFLKR